MGTSLKHRGTLLLLLAVFHGLYGMQLLKPGLYPAAMQFPDFAGAPQFTPADAGAIQYATNTSSTIVKFGGAYYLWRDGGWFRNSAPTGIYWKIKVLPAELRRISTE